jgi:hypothetical protein
MIKDTSPFVPAINIFARAEYLRLRIAENVAVGSTGWLMTPHCAAEKVLFHLGRSGDFGGQSTGHKDTATSSSSHSLTRFSGQLTYAPVVGTIFFKAALRGVENTIKDDKTIGQHCLIPRLGLTGE